jgi:hypothetical protein
LEVNYQVLKVKRYAIILFFMVGTVGLAQNDSAAVKENTDSLSSRFNIPIFSTTGGDIENDMDQQDVSSLLSSSRDVFAQFAVFQFGAARYRMRGYLAENQSVMVNGVNVNDLETGFSSWSNWGGLNDVTRFTENRVGLAPSRLAFTGAGGYTNIDSKASSFRKGTRVSYANGNRIWAHRVMVTHSTGMQQNGWASTISFSNRYGDQVYVPGTYFNATSYYISVDKRIDDRHLLSFTGFVAPIEQGGQHAATHEVYDLAGSHYYNSAWGYQKGVVRNSAVRSVKRPMLMLSHEFKLNAGDQLKTSLYYNFGRLIRTGLNWNKSPNANPDFYQYLPSYYYMRGDTASGDYLTNKWETDPTNVAQVNYDRLIAMNQANLYGGNGNTTQTRARYIIENRIERLSNIGFNAVYSKRANKLFFTAGVNGNIQKTRKFKEIEDLLGASFWLNQDQFVNTVGISSAFGENDIDNPGREVKKGERFGYDYAININRAEVWSQAEYASRNVDVFVAASVSDSKVWREGFVANGKFPTNSKGLSAQMNFFNYGVKGGLTYKLDGRNFITVNGGYLTRTPETNGIFICQTVRNDITQGITSEKVASWDVNYLAKYPRFKFRATYYNTKMRNQNWARTYYNDEFNNFVNYIMTGVGQDHQGVEVGLEKTVFISHTIQGAFGYGQFLYKGTPIAQAWAYNDATSLFTDRKVYWNNYKVGQSPQLVTGISYKYSGKKQWFAGISFNYFDQIYVDMNPDRRTAEGVVKYASTDPQVDQILGQERLPSYYTVNLNGGKSFRIMRKYFLNLNLSVNNLLNNTNIIINGFEQLRWDPSSVSKFPNKYYYMTGTTYMISANFNF